MSNRHMAAWFPFGRWCAAAALACVLAGCAATAERADRQWRDLVHPDPQEANDPGTAAEGEPPETSGSAGHGGSWLDDFSFKAMTNRVTKLAGRGPNKTLARELFQQAQDQYSAAAAMPEGRERTAKFLLAGDKFAKAAELWPDSSHELDALFMAGEAHFFADHYWDATRFYEKLVKAHPNNRYLDTVDARRFAIARYWLQINEENPEPFYYFNFLDESLPWKDIRGHALRQYEKIRRDDPTGRLADDATLAVANAHFQARRYLKADEYYTDLRRTYPTSEHQFSAHYLGLKAKLLSYLGPDYSGSALDEGEKLIKLMRRQFPDDAAREKEFLDRAAAEIRYKKAEKLHYFARYYDKRGEYRAAGYYYQQVARDYSETPFAKNAGQRLAKIEHLPPTPPQKLPWLVKLFPTSDKVKPILEAAKAPPAGHRISIDDNGQVQQASHDQ
jgi:outer membrane protein assembly factor BamD (BamD/ComL family)